MASRLLSSIQVTATIVEPATDQRHCPPAVWRLTDGPEVRDRYSSREVRVVAIRRDWPSVRL
jgi:hypothetical protein